MKNCQDAGNPILLVTNNFKHMQLIRSGSSLGYNQIKVVVLLLPVIFKVLMELFPRKTTTSSKTKR